jgi:uncharacterized protein (TIGR02118 family)
VNDNKEDVMLYKSIAAGTPDPITGRSNLETQEYWFESHGKLVANLDMLVRYGHFLTVPEVYDLPADELPGMAAWWTGISQFTWRDAPLSATPPPTGSQTPEQEVLLKIIGADDRQSFDRVKDWPRHMKRADVVGSEHVIVDGDTTPSMINAMLVVSRLPGLDHQEFFEHWMDVHGPLVAKLPGLRRYLQNHGIFDINFSLTHDGWSELWFDDLDAALEAFRSPEWQAVLDDARTLFVMPMSAVIGPYYEQKDRNWKPKDFGALSMTDDEIRQRLEEQGYTALAADPEAPAKIKAAAEKGRLGVWTKDHLSTYDESAIDARPSR